jgi:hypothetical protein
VSELYCISCASSEDSCECYEEHQLLVEAFYCDNCGSICSEDELSATDLCEDCHES